jgi:hypothetical protein
MRVHAAQITFELDVRDDRRDRGRDADLLEQLDSDLARERGVDTDSLH